MIQIAKQNNFFPGTVLATNFKCPKGMTTTAQPESITCSSAADTFQIEFLKSTREVVRLTSAYATTCKASGMSALKRMVDPCELIPQSQANVGKEMVYTVKCEPFVKGEVTCKPSRLDFSVGYSETHRDLLKAAQAEASQPGMQIDGRTYVKAVSVPKIHQDISTNVCDRLYKAEAVAIIKRTKSIGIENSQMKYAADSQTVSSEFYCKKTLTGKKLCPSGTTLNKASECVTTAQPLANLCNDGSKLDMGGSQKIDVDKNGVATEIIELKKDCFEDSCYPNSFENGKNCMMCPPGSTYNPAFKSGNTENPCVKNI